MQTGKSWATQCPASIVLRQARTVMGYMRYAHMLLVVSNGVYNTRLKALRHHIHAVHTELSMLVSR